MVGGCKSVIVRDVLNSCIIVEDDLRGSALVHHKQLIAFVDGWQQLAADNVLHDPEHIQHDVKHANATSQKSQAQLWPYIDHLHVRQAVCLLLLLGLSVCSLMKAQAYRDTASAMLIPFISCNTTKKRLRP